VGKKAATHVANVPSDPTLGPRTHVHSCTRT